jgi:hypothetical protein
MKKYLTHEQIMEMAMDKLDVIRPSGDHIVSYAERLELDYEDSTDQYYTIEETAQEIASEIIATIIPNAANFEYCAKTGKINGSLHADLIRCMVDFHLRMNQK